MNPDQAAEKLGITTRTLFVRAHKAYGEAKDSPIGSYNRYTAVGEVPRFVKLFIMSLKEGK